MKSLYIINSTSRAADYGVGTYIQQVLNAVKKRQFSVNIVYLFSEEDSMVYEEDNVRFIKITSPRVGRSSSEVISRYYRNVYYFLSPYISKQDDIVFHFNLIQGEELIRILKQKFKCRILLTVHYMTWSFALLGDMEHLKKIIATPESKEDERLVDSFFYERDYINENVDHVIAIAEHSYNTLCSIYNIPDGKITLIPNGLQDCYTQLSREERKSVRESFSFDENEILLVFAGRIDEVKGIYALLETFNFLLAKHDKVRLVIIGDGNYERCFKASAPHWSKVVYTGFVDKSTLYQLYSIADIGIVPSYHEEFGYVALEMMMMGLPLIVNNSTGLSELVEKDVNGAYISITSDENKVSDFSNVIEHLISDEKQRRAFVKEGRRAFKQKYELSVFKNSMLQLYDYLFSQMI